MSVWAGDGEPIDRYGHELRKSKKDRKCTACRETIRKGDFYAYQFWLCDGSYSSSERCLRCEAIYVTLTPKVRERDREDFCAPDLDCGHTWEENFNEPPPPEVARLAFMTREEMQAEFGSVIERNRRLARGLE